MEEVLLDYGVSPFSFAQEPEGGNLAEPAPGFAQELATSTSLTTLNLSNNNLGSLHAAHAPGFAQGLATSTSLTTLNLSNNNLGAPGFAQAQGLNPNLSPGPDGGRLLGG